MTKTAVKSTGVGLRAIYMYDHPHLFPKAPRNCQP